MERAPEVTIVRVRVLTPAKNDAAITQWAARAGLTAYSIERRPFAVSAHACRLCGDISDLASLFREVRGLPRDASRWR